MQSKSHELPELYNLWLTVKEFPCQNFVFKNARLLLHRPDAEEKVHPYDFATLIRDYDPTDSWTDYPKQFIAYDLFTRDEKAAIEAYLATHHFRGLSSTSTVKPSPFRIIGHLAMPPVMGVGKGSTCLTRKRGSIVR